MANNSLQLGPRQIDLNRGQIRDGPVGRLTTRELALLRYLVEHSGEVVTREQMLTDVWGYSKTTDTRTVYATLHNLRKKIEADSKNPQWLTTAHGAGYKFHLPDTPNVAAPPPLVSAGTGTTLPWASIFGYHRGP